MSDYNEEKNLYSGTENDKAEDTTEGFVSDSGCTDGYERHESHTYERDSGDADYSRNEKDEARYTSGTSGGTFYRAQNNSGYGGGGHSQSGYTGEPLIDPADKKSGLGIASMVCGIVSLACCCFPFGGLIIAIVGLVLGIISQKQKPNGFALAGIITSSFGIAFGIISIVVVFVSELPDNIFDYPDYGNDSGSDFDPNNQAGLIGRIISFLRIK